MSPEAVRVEGLAEWREGWLIGGMGDWREGWVAG